MMRGKPTGQRGAVANSIAFQRIDAAPAAKIRCLPFPSPAPGTTPAGAR